MAADPKDVLTSGDAEAIPDDEIRLGIGTVAYYLPTDDARRWHRQFRDLLDGNGSDHRTERTPDVSTDTWDFDGSEETVYIIEIGGHHPEFGDGMHHQTAFMDENELSRFVDMIDDALKEE